MPCDLAVSIAKAALSRERLRALLTADAIKDVVLTYLVRQYAALSPTLLSAQGNVVRYRLGRLTLTIADGEVSLDGTRARATDADQLATNVSELLTQLAGRLFQKQVQDALSGVTTRARMAEVQGRSQQAAVFTINL
jgi:hypothetical protein